MYLVIETCDRTASDVRAAKDIRDATEIANQLLEEHCKTLDKHDVYEAYAGPVPPDKWPPDIQLADPSAGEPCAWSNLNNLDYDAHVIALGPEESANALDILLKELCKKRMDSEDSDCGDGSCEGCPISQALGMACGLNPGEEEPDEEDD